jgi:hypothetical protein
LDEDRNSLESGDKTNTTAASFLALKKIPANDCRVFFK